MPVFKAIYNVTVLVEADTVEQAESYFGHRDLAALLETDADTGDAIASVHLASVDYLPPNLIGAELLALGNDGTFFNLGDDEDDEP